MPSCSSREMRLRSASCAPMTRDSSDSPESAPSPRSLRPCAAMFLKSMKSLDTTSKSHRRPSRPRTRLMYTDSCPSLTVRNAHRSAPTTRPPFASGNAQKLWRSSANTMG